MEASSWPPDSKLAYSTSTGELYFSTHLNMSPELSRDIARSPVITYLLKVDRECEQSTNTVLFEKMKQKACIRRSRSAW